MQVYETFYSLWFHKKFHFSIHLEDDQIDGTTMETMTNFIFWVSKITADGDCSHEIKRCLLLGRKVMTNLGSILKSRDITLSTNVLIKAIVFPVVMYGCESWTIKKPEHWRIDAFELWYWKRLLRVPWTARRSNQSILKEISPECSLEGLMLKLKLQYSGHLMWRADSFEKTLMLGKIEGRRRRGQQRMRWLDGISNSMDMGLGRLGNWWWTGRPGLLRFIGSQRVGHDWATELTELNNSYIIISKTKTREIFSIETLVILLSYRNHSGHLCMLFLVSCVFNPPLPALHQKNLWLLPLYLSFIVLKAVL